ncbi:hypothetical protein [Bradyrhizobium sp. USDA 313]|uniref:hypothetical protein n=1 Tax=Bradyrhizobium sp. USDA 313 TaxID=3156307 RepID=UPI0035196A84
MTTKLPSTVANAEASLLHADALTYARKWVRMVRDEQIPHWGNAGQSWFDKQESQRFVRQMMRHMARSPSGMIDLCNLARAGLGLADQTARELILEYEHARELMPPALLAYNMELVDPRRGYRRLTSQKKEDRFLRDIAITVIIGDVCSRFRLKPHTPTPLETHEAGSRQRLQHRSRGFDSGAIPNN